MTSHDPDHAPNVRARPRPTLRIAIAFLVALSFGGPTAPSLAQEATLDRPDLRIRLQFARAGGVYDPAYWRYTSDGWVYPSLFNGLVRKTPGTGGELEADLASSWSISDDGRTYTFELRPSVTFHRGYGELTAEDVVFSLQRQIDDENATFHAIFDNVAEVVAVDDHTVQIVLAEAQPSFLLAVLTNPNGAGFIVSKRAVEELGDAFAETPVGTGPFVLEGITAAEEVVLRSHDEYFRGAPEAASLTYVHIGEESVAAAALQRGELDILYTRGNPEVAQQLLDDGTIEAVTVVEHYNIMHVAISPDLEPTQDVRVRRALAHALDKDVIELLIPGLDQPAHVLRPAELLGGSSADSLTTYDYDPEAARALLAEAGQGDGFTLRLMFQTREPEATIAQWLAESWTAVGIDVELEGVEATTAHDRRARGDFEVTFMATSRAGDPDYFFTDVLHSGSVGAGGSNYSRYDRADALIEAARFELVAERRQEIYHEIQARVMEDVPVIPLIYRAYVAAWRDPVASFVPDSTIQFWPDTIRIRSAD